MHERLKHSWLIAVFYCTTAFAQLPADQTVTYDFHADPADPTSAITLTATLQLTAMQSVGNDVGWEISAIEFREHGEGGAADRVWDILLPFVDTVDGLWWVTHVDAANPELDEYDLPPWLDGIATSEDPAVDDLSYSLQGISGLQSGPYATTTSLDWYFIVDAEPEPINDGEDEPADMPESPAKPT